MPTLNQTSIPAPHLVTLREIAKAGVLDLHAYLAEAQIMRWVEDLLDAELVEQLSVDGRPAVRLTARGEEELTLFTAIFFTSKVGVNPLFRSALGALPTVYNYSGEKILAITDSFGAGPYFLFSPVAQKLGAVLAINAVPGRCLAHGTDNAEGDGTQRIPAVDALPAFLTANSDAKVLLIEPGINDFHYSVPIGTLTSTDNTTVCGALNQMLDLATGVSGLRVVVILPTIRADANRNGTGGGLANQALEQPYVAAIQAVAIAHQVEVVDQFTNPDLAYAKLGENTLDGVCHPETPLGRARYYSPIAHALVPDQVKPAVDTITVLNATSLRIAFTDSLRVLSLSGLTFKRNDAVITPTAFTRYDGNSAALPLSIWNFTLPSLVSTDVLTLTTTAAAGADFAGNTLTATQYQIALSSLGPVVAPTTGYQSQSIEWDTTPNPYGTRLSFDTTTKVLNNPSGSSWLASAQSPASVAPYGHTGEIGRYVIPILEKEDGCMSGLTADAPLNGASGVIYDTLDFGFYHSNNAIRVYENGAIAFSMGMPAGNVKAEIVVTPTQVTYLINEELVYTSLIAPTFPLKAVATFASSSSKIINAILRYYTS